MACRDATVQGIHRSGLITPIRLYLMAIELLNPTQLNQMRPAGAFVAEVLTTLVATAEVGMDL